MIELPLADVAAATGGTLAGADPTCVVTGPVVVDSRLAAPGALFVALRGHQVDGHDYAAAAVQAGALAVLAERPVPAPAILVDDGVRALGRLARAVLDRLATLPVVGITGSQGKTGTKDLLAAVLRSVRPTVAPEGSYNNEVGLPLTVLRVDAATRALVLEMGARARGDVAYLCTIAPPRVGVVLNVGSAHLGEFGSREAIAAAKGELVEALPRDGTAVLNADDRLVRRMAARTTARVLTFGHDPLADVRAEHVRLDERARASFVLHGPGGAAAVRLRLHGAHQVPNALAAAAAATALDVPVDTIATALAAATGGSRWRMEVRERPDGVTVVNDAYNANPESVRAALEALVAMSGGRRTWAVLGEMRELGPTSPAEHEAVGRLAARLGISRVAAVGEATRPLHAGATAEPTWRGRSCQLADPAAAVRLLRDELRPGDVVLVKASRAAGLEVVAEALLLAEPGGEPAA